MTRRLSGLDASFLYAETPTMPLHGGSITILDPSTAPDGFGVEQVRRDIAARVDQLVPFRLQVAASRLGLRQPVWVDTRGFDVDRHVHAAAVPRPGTDRQLAELAAELFARPLPRDRPLWQVWFVEGLAGGRVALVWKAHHALMGGVEVTNLLRLLYDLDVPSTREEGQSGLGEQFPSPVTALARAAVDVATVPVRVARLLGESAVAAVRVSRFLLGGGRPASTLPFAGARTSLNGALVADRTCAFASLPLDDVKTVKIALGVKVNDVVLAVCGAALRSYLYDRGELPRRSLNATVMAAVGGVAGGHAGAVLGNATSILGATLATDVADPLDRLRRISASTQTAKLLHRALGDTMVMRIAEALPPGIFGAAMRVYGATGLPSVLRPPFNAVISNVPGPPVPLYSSGARVLSCYLFGPLIQSVALDITVISYAGALDIGIAASPNLVPDPWPIADAMPAALEALVTAVR
jgi:WS/DGAT/MGAT family acyltransferase